MINLFLAPVNQSRSPVPQGERRQGGDSRHHGRSRKKIYHVISIPGSVARAAASLPSLPPPSSIAADASSSLARWYGLPLLLSMTALIRAPPDAKFHLSPPPATHGDRRVAPSPTTPGTPWRPVSWSPWLPAFSPRPHGRHPHGGCCCVEKGAKVDLPFWLAHGMLSLEQAVSINVPHCFTQKRQWQEHIVKRKRMRRNVWFSFNLCGTLFMCDCAFVGTFLCALALAAVFCCAHVKLF
ncbi:uncharacterized protein LOC123430022 [Hordeum vulgare subsp. vulgare]|uniref:uncharacterized protein LOC123430022 n=1 Tax=Hordeum vulgare subsp. vulgare TaxID=112509 RepID=UPI001D1A41D2|nr:uncharacterized protein LOC123430022 [Hordeum vulgare subsp. vulgare]